MSLKTFLEKLFPFLFAAMQRTWDQLTPIQQSAITNAGQIGQLLKNNLDMLGDDLKVLIAKQTGLPDELIGNMLLSLAAKFGLTTTSENDAIAFLQKKLNAAASDEEWNGLLTIILNAGGIILSGGSLNWAQIAIGIGEWAYHKFVKPAVV